MWLVWSVWGTVTVEDEIRKVVMGQFIWATGDCKNFCFWDFPGGPVAKTPCSQCRGPSFHPWSGKIPHVTTKTWHRQINKSTKRKKKETRGWLRTLGFRLLHEVRFGRGTSLMVGRKVA